MYIYIYTCTLYQHPPSSPSIHHGLDSHNQVEVEAAIFATSCLVRHSGTFAAGVCEKIATMVQGTAWCKVRHGARYGMVQGMVHGARYGCGIIIIVLLLVMETCMHTCSI